MYFRLILAFLIIFSYISCKDIESTNKDNYLSSQESLKKDSLLLDSLLNIKDKFFLDYSYGNTRSQYGLICEHLVKEGKLTENERNINWENTEEKLYKNK